MNFFQNIPGRRNGNAWHKLMWLISLGRNALVVVFGTTLAYIFSTYDAEPFRLTGK